MSPLLRELDEALQREGLLPAGAACAVAVSGGRDSMVLLAGLDALRVRHGWRLAVAHFHHQLRGADADADRDFVATATAERGLAWIPGTADVRAAREPGESPEEVARRLRHRFLAEAARGFGAERVAVAHHADDQTELFLLRLLRGAGGRALGGMNPVDPSPADPGVRLVRPLLGFSREWLGRAAKEFGVTWREDASNRDPEIRRNRVRHELVPLLESRFQPALGRVLERARVRMRDEAIALTGWASDWLAGDPTVPFPALPVAVRREVIRLQLERLGVPVEFDLVEALRESEVEVPIQVDARRRLSRDAGGRLRVLAAEAGEEAFRFAALRVDLGECAGQADFGGGCLSWAWEDRAIDGRPNTRGAETVGVGETLERLDAGRVGGVIRLRHWRPGDRFEPIGLGSEARLQDLFTNARVPAAERRRRVVAEAADGRLFWVEGLRIGEVAKRTPETTRILVWRWRRGSVSG